MTKEELLKISLSKAVEIYKERNGSFIHDHISFIAGFNFACVLLTLEEEEKIDD